jgi:phosphatidylserine decarboxylase
MAVPPALTALVAVAAVAEVVPGRPIAWGVAILLAAVSAFGLAFFRDPDRTAADGLVAPAHGRVLSITDDDRWTRVATFMGPFDVHVVRAPLDGTVRRMERSGRGFARADRPGADGNVRLAIDLDGDAGEHRVELVSGWFARRIVPYVSVGDRVVRGARIGLIRFGSRVDVLVPRGSCEVSVAPGHRVRAAETSLGVMAHARR